MIVTLTANPSVDRTIEVAALRPGTVIRARSGRVDAGGKGVNVARALAAHGRAAKAVLPSGGAEGAQLEALLAGSGLELLTVRIAGPVRANVTVVESDGTTTKLNEPGPRLSRDELDALAVTLRQAAARADWGRAVRQPVPRHSRRLVRRAHPAAARYRAPGSDRQLGAAAGQGHRRAPRPGQAEPGELAELTGRPRHDRGRRRRSRDPDRPRRAHGAHQPGPGRCRARPRGRCLACQRGGDPAAKHGRSRRRAARRLPGRRRWRPRRAGRSGRLGKRGGGAPRISHARPWRYQPHRHPHHRLDRPDQQRARRPPARGETADSASQDLIKNPGQPTVRVRAAVATRARTRRSASFMVQRSDRWRPYRMVNLGAVGVPDNWRAISAYSAGHLLVLFWIVDLLGKLRYVRFPVGCQAGCR